ncbi:MAG TPA: hypothetical protein PKA64_20625, partial [Myxococcota bacterium]|nr:hypothetical protein [Myxococcota bacterium]
MRASRAAILIAATSACAPAPDRRRGGPPPALAWVRAVVVAEHDAYALLETTAPPGLSVRVWWSGATTTACGAGVPGACLGLSAPQVWGTGVVGADGRAWVIRPAEPPAYGNLWLQADISVPGRAPLLSATFAALRQEATSDMDGDGLRAGQEVDARLDPRLPDTDGGGSGDLQELSVDHTDPLARGDDLAGERACRDGVDD